MGPMDQMVVPPTGFPSPSDQLKAAPPQSCTSMPRCCLYHACSALGSFALKKMPPMPVTRFMCTPQRELAELLGALPYPGSQATPTDFRDGTKVVNAFFRIVRVIHEHRRTAKVRARHRTV